MFDNLSSRLKSVAERVRGKGRLSEANITDAVRDVRRALVEADVALPVVKDFIGRVRKRAIGSEITRSLTPGQVFIKILHDELTKTLGHAEVDGDGINLRHQPPVVILLAGLQGVGKTTTAAKLARHLAQRQAKKTMLASLDTRRPAAILQLEQLAEQVGAAFCTTDTTATPVSIAEQAVSAARRGSCDVLILDTAGRTRLDEELLAELGQIHTATSPAETLFVVDSMAGQDAVNVAAAFSEALPLTGVILTKTDGDARGGAALSVRTVTDKPIRFIGTGEDTEGIEAFHPDRMASRILGMGDVLSLVEEVQDKVDHEKAQKLVNKVRKGKGFDLADLRDQLSQMASMGGIESLLGKLPIPGGVDAGKLAEQVDSRAIARQIAIINSMTPEERRFPKVIKGSRKRRIAMGSGQAIQDVNRLLKQHLQMQKMMGKLGKGGKMKDMLRGMTGG
ncbi:MAG: signal recognition particle protein [Gammaproteobacteria bacterium]|jgi:signal recognition particle subunit SRP54|nr:signal recognition particle protein [Chromatiales bacterium]MDP6413889.1 signal recognition particle protein [Gammaproteobacteria bacterium]